MKLLASVLLLLSSVACASGQVSPQEKLAESLRPFWSTDLYVRSLSACVEASVAEHPGRNTVIVLQNGVLGDLEPVRALPSKIGATNIEYLTASDTKKRYKRLRKPFHVMAIQPAQNLRDTLIVDCALFRVGIRRWKLLLGVSGGYMGHWRYDCQSKQFVKFQVEPWYPRID